MPNDKPPETLRNPTAEEAVPVSIARDPQTQSHAELVATIARIREQLTAARAKNKVLEDEAEIKTQIDNIIDEERNEQVPQVLSSISQYLWDSLGRDKIEKLSFAYVNETNDYLEHSYLTRVTPGAKQGEDPTVEAITDGAFPNRIFSAKKNTDLYEENQDTYYITLKLGKQCLGIIEIHPKPDQRLSGEQENLCHKAISVIDTYLDGALKPLRAKKNRRKIARILDRAGTDIVFENGEEKGFRIGLIGALSYLCKKTGAKFIRLALDVTGDKSTYPVELLVNASGEQKESDHAEAIGNMESRSKDITVPAGAKIDDNTPTQVDGKITFLGDDLDNEDQQALDLAAEQIISTVGSWRADYQHTVEYGLPPKVALLKKKGLLQTRSVENVTMGFTDIYGFTAISEKFREITRKYGLQEDYMIRLMGAYEQMGKDVAEESGGCFDKLVGDCLIINAGPPYTTDGQDCLGMKDHEPMFHAINGLKIAMRLRKALTRVEKVFADLLAEMAEEIEKNEPPLSPKAQKARDKTRIGKSPEELKTMRLNEFCQKNNLYPRLRVTQGISSGEVSVGLVNHNDPDSRHYSTSYTIIGDEMNLAARLQAKATPHEIIVSGATKEHLENAIQQNIAVPFDERGITQTWEEFKTEMLGVDHHDFDLVPVFEETMLDLKNKAGYEFAYRLNFQKVSRETADFPATLNAEELLARNGQFKVINHDTKGKFLSAQLENIQQPGQQFDVLIPLLEPDIRYVTPQDYDRRVKENSDLVLQIHDHTMELAEYRSIKDLIDKHLDQIEPNIVYEADKIPHGIYEIEAEYSTDQEDSDEKIFKLNMLGIPVMVRVNTGRILGLEQLNNKPRAKSIFAIHHYLDEKTQAVLAEQLAHLVRKPEKAVKKSILFVHSSGEYRGEI